VLAAAITEFALSGYAGTSTESIATRAGISQPYLFRLFGTKKDLFVATFDLVGDRIIRELTAVSEGLEGEQALEAMGMAYVELMQDPELLQVQLHGLPPPRRIRTSPELPSHLRGAGRGGPRAHPGVRRRAPPVLRHGDVDQRPVRHRPVVPA